MSWYAEINGEVTTSAKALPLVLDLIGEWTSLESEGIVQLPQVGDAITIQLCDHYRNLGRHLPEAVYKLAREYPEQTKGEFTIMSNDGSNVAETYRVSQGRMYRRALHEAPEREVFLHEFKVRNGPTREILVTERDLARIRVNRKNGNHVIEKEVIQPHG